MGESEISARLKQARERKPDDRTLAQRATDLAQDLLHASLKQLKSDEQITLLNEGNATEVWVKDTGNINNGYPILKWQLETN